METGQSADSQSQSGRPTGKVYNVDHYEPDLITDSRSSPRHSNGIDDDLAEMSNFIPPLSTTARPLTPWGDTTDSSQMTPAANGGYFNRRHMNRFNSKPTVASVTAPPDKCLKVPVIENGMMRCAETYLGRKCTPECSEGHDFYQKFTSRPPTYYCNARRVDWEIRRFIPDCSPVVKNQRYRAG
jgi:hypothetical protein